MQKLINTIQNYAWGSTKALTELYGISNPEHHPMAELWMGAHPKSSSQVRDQQNQLQSLRDIINADKSALLGDQVAQRFNELPFLFKVLCAECPLSIQVHPDIAAAQAGYARENALGIPLDSPQRNYKDANHKPELVYALTPFLAMNGFREFTDMVQTLRPLTSAHPSIARFIQQPDETRLRSLFTQLLAMQGEEKKQALSCLKAAQKTQQGAAWQAIEFIAKHFPKDSGLFAPLLLNVITLEPGQAMFLFAQTPHAYLHGVALEIMANSDNVLRAGLTPKHIDIDELIANVKFTGKPLNTLLTQPVTHCNETYFPIPVDDFAFSLHDISGNGCQISQDSAAILFCIFGNIQVNCYHQQLTLLPGESVFISASDPAVHLTGNGRIARAFNTLS